MDAPRAGPLALRIAVPLVLVAACATSTETPPMPVGEQYVAMPPGQEPTDHDLSREIRELDSPNPQWRAEAAWQIGFLGAHRMAPRLLAALETEKAPEALDGLLIGLALLDVQEVVPRARAWLDHDSVVVRASAANALAILRDRPSFARLAADIEARALPEDQTCEGILAEAGAPEATHLFHKLLRSPKLDDRLVGIGGLARLGVGGCLPELRRAMRSEELRERITAACRLAWVRDRAAFDLLKEYMKEEGAPWLPFLNAWADPTIWSKLAAVHFRQRDLATHSLGEVLDAITRATGIPIEIAPDVDPALRAVRFGSHRVQALGFDPTGLKILVGVGSQMLAPAGWIEVTWITTNGRIRIVSHAEAARFCSTFEPR